MVDVFRATNFPLPAAPPMYHVSGAHPNPSAGSAIAPGHSSWGLVIDTTGLPNAQQLADVIVQYHYTNVQLGVTGMANQGHLTNLEIVGGLFTGWIDDCGDTLFTTYTPKTGGIQHLAALGCGLNRIMNAYPDLGRFIVKTSPGYARVPSAVLQLN
jgi:hypothetical protein